MAQVMRDTDMVKQSDSSRRAQVSELALPVALAATSVGLLGLVPGVLLPVLFAGASFAGILFAWQLLCISLERAIPVRPKTPQQ